MPVWQQLYDELKDKGFMVVAVAEESRGADHARPWIEQAKSDYWQLIDTEHRLEDLYNLVNVPQAIWIDEQGNDRAAAGDGRLDRSFPAHGSQDPHHVARGPGRAAGRAAGLLDAVRAWVTTGKHALPADAARREPAEGHA